MIIEQLREATSEKHQELDNAMLPVFKDATNQEKYIELLKKFYGSFKPLYTLIDNYVGIEEIPDLPQRRSVANLEKDLLHFDIDLVTISQLKQLPSITSKADAMGALYVLEGSTMGGVYLAKMLEKQLGIDEMSGLSFFSGYGKETKAMWLTFIDSLEQFAANCNCDLQITTAASKTFDSIRHFITVKN